MARAPAPGAGRASAPPSYFRHSGGDTALLAHEAVEILGPQWVALVQTAIQAMGSPFPIDINERERIVDQLDVDSPQLLGELDQRWYALEADQPADERLDQFIWSQKASFFAGRPAR